MANAAASVVFTSTIGEHRDAVIDYATAPTGSRPLPILRPLHEPRKPSDPMRVATTCACGQPLVGFGGTATRCPGCGALWILGSPMQIA